MRSVHHDSSVVDDAPVDSRPVDAQFIPDAAIPDAGPITDGSVNPDGIILVDAGFPDAGGTACSVLTQAGCTTGQKCAWVLDTDPTSTRSGLGSDRAARPTAPSRSARACTILPAARAATTTGKAGACVSGTCKSICDNNGGTPACGASQACVTYDGLFANEGATTTPAGVCDPSCNPLDRQRLRRLGHAPHQERLGLRHRAPTVGCYGTPSRHATTYFTCSPPAGRPVTSRTAACIPGTGVLRQRLHVGLHARVRGGRDGLE